MNALSRPVRPAAIPERLWQQMSWEARRRAVKNYAPVREPVKRAPGRAPGIQRRCPYCSTKVVDLKGHVLRKHEDMEHDERWVAASQVPA